MTIKERIAEIRSMAQRAADATPVPSEDPLDGHETVLLARFYHTEIDFNNGNLTQEEYDLIITALQRNPWKSA